MSIHKYGDITISVELLQQQGEWQEFGISIRAPRKTPEFFRVWHVAQGNEKVVAQVLIYDLIEAYENPQKFLRGMNESSHIPAEYIDRDQNRDFIRVANKLHNFLNEAHFAIYKEFRKNPIKPFTILERSPREWMPTRKSN